MSNLRDLLIDIRLELRKLVRDFQKTEMRTRIDEAVSLLGRLPDASLAALGKQAASVSAATPAAVDTHSRNRVALAWQAAAADLRLSDPAIYEALRKNAMARLASKNPNDLEPEPSAAISANGDIHSTTGEHSIVDSAAGSPVAPPAAARLQDDTAEPSMALLAEVAAGNRTLSERHREWCIGEAMVVSGFSVSPVELIEQGDSAIAQMILTSREANSATG